jgi:hypothetical protein
VRRWAREGRLRPGYWSGWQWKDAQWRNRCIDPDACRHDRVILTHRHRSDNGEWKDEQYPVRIERTMQLGWLPKYPVSV